ncbi:vitamin K epoxide reductase family protein [Pontibacter sp. G13]|uniref:vitamin K epoxide reductase family protein n=1 Tax=Pontibacter sp. G13 TaxID=3074898 RepID=UPI0028893CA5|nr:vitamin K epoxide reductase family protein [Pontibacter sp. G13]WNJ20370.1 vitamin K epoxide reductase family protein [Pontibacter sp. G13]
MNYASVNFIQSTFSQFLDKLGTRYTQVTLDWLSKHPDFPSMLSLHHGLNRLGIRNMAMRPDFRQLQEELPRPFLAHLQFPQEGYGVVTEMSGDSVTLLRGAEQEEVLSHAEFLKAWSGVVLVADTEAQVQEKDYTRNLSVGILNRMRIPFLILMTIITLIWGGWQAHGQWPSPLVWGWMGTHAVGLLLAVPLMLQRFSPHHQIIQRFCATDKKRKINCQQILESPAALAIGNLSWGEIGFGYFLLMLLWSAWMPQSVSFPILQIMAVLGGVYPVYSIYYQGFIAKQWCKLCLFVQGVLLVQAGYALWMISLQGLTWPSSFGLAVFAGAVWGMAALWGGLKPILTGWSQSQSELPALNRIKYDRQVLELLQSAYKPVDTQDAQPILSGNPSGTHTITLVVNPNCGPCQKLHRDKHELLAGRTDIRIEEIFMSDSDEDSTSYQSALKMIALAQKLPQTEYERVSAAFYQHDYARVQAWADRIPLTTEELSAATERLRLQNEWGKRYRVSSTPKILYQYRSLPTGYTMKDLPYLLV